MSDEPNTYQYIVKKAAMLNVDALNDRIAELESANTFLKEQNDNLSFLSNRAGNVYRAQNINDFVSFINNHLLNGDLEIEYVDADEYGINFVIPNATVNEQLLIQPAKQSYTVSGTLTVEWTAELSATDEDEAAEIAERHIHDADLTAYFPHHDDVDEADIDTYSLTVEVADTYKN
jgi:hypothetical protein